MVKDRKLVALEDLIKVSEEKTEKFLRSFLCPKNKQLEIFLHTKAIEGSKRDLNKTFLLIEDNVVNGVTERVLLGYFTIANKIFDFAEGVAGNPRKIITGNKFSKCFSTILIANIAKNEGALVNGIHPISGKELMDIAILKCRTVKNTMGLKIVAVEFEDNPKLSEFYEDYGFLIIQDNVHNGYKLAYLKI